MGGFSKGNLVNPFSLATSLERPSVNVARRPSDEVVADHPVLRSLAFAFPETLPVLHVETDVVYVGVVGGEHDVKPVLDEADFGL